MIKLKKILNEGWFSKKKPEVITFEYMDNLVKIPNKTDEDKKKIYDYIVKQFGTRPELYWQALYFIAINYPKKVSYDEIFKYLVSILGQYNVDPEQLNSWLDKGFYAKNIDRSDYNYYKWSVDRKFYI